jgi:hypothetical protein
VTAAGGRTRALLLNGVLVGRGLAPQRAPSSSPSPGAEPSLRRVAAMAAALPATPPATPAGRRLRRTRSSDAVAAQYTATTRADAQPPQRRLRSAGVITQAQAGEAQPRPQSPLFSFRCPITHVRPPEDASRGKGS